MYLANRRKRHISESQFFFSADKGKQTAFISPFLYHVAQWDCVYENIKCVVGIQVGPPPQFSVPFCTGVQRGL